MSRTAIVFCVGWCAVLVLLIVLRDTTARLIVGGVACVLLPLSVLHGKDELDKKHLHDFNYESWNRLSKRAELKRLIDEARVREGITDEPDEAPVPRGVTVRFFAPPRPADPEPQSSPLPFPTGQADPEAPAS